MASTMGAVWVFVGLVLLGAGAAKLQQGVEARRDAFAAAGLPSSVVPGVARMLPTVEVVIGAAAILGFAPIVFASAASVLTLSFLVFVAQRVVTGRNAPCHCFGASTTETGLVLAIRNGVLAASSLAVLVAAIVGPLNGWFAWPSIVDASSGSAGIAFPGTVLLLLLLVSGLQILGGVEERLRAGSSAT